MILNIQTDILESHFYFFRKHVYRWNKNYFSLKHHKCIYITTVVVQLKSRHDGTKMSSWIAHLITRYIATAITLEGKSQYRWRQLVQPFAGYKFNRVETNPSTKVITLVLFVGQLRFKFTEDTFITQFAI